MGLGFGGAGPSFVTIKSVEAKSMGKRLRDSVSLNGRPCGHECRHPPTAIISLQKPAWETTQPARNRRAGPNDGNALRKPSKIQEISG
jgi:hypothetical protein